jgi:hypothetical protein
VGGTLEQGIKVRIVRGLGVRAEDRGIHVDVYVGTDIGQASPAFALHYTLHAAPPQVFTVASSLQLP